jgi:predicted outer membrane protein
MRRHFLQAVLPALLAGTLCIGCGDDADDDDDNRDGGREAGTNPQDAAARPDGGGDAGMDAATSNMDAALDAATASDAGRLNDNQIVGVLAAVNSGEIMAGTLASTRGTNASVRSFAMSMVSMHTAAQTRQSALGIAVAPSETSNGLTAEAMTMQQNLMNTPMSLLFDQRYIESQVIMHDMALKLIDSTLLTSAMSQALRNELTMTRMDVQMHYNQAVQIRASLAADAGAGDGGTRSDAGGIDGGS